ncbi:MAG: alpha/beta fold hydrolase, partial [Pseudomonadota bacterium]
MIPADETFDGTWPYKPHFFEGNGFSMHYVDENSTGDETFLCVHGEPTWGYLYRNFIPRLARHGRVIVPDHMGFGKSETPQDRRYTIEEHCQNLERLVLKLDLRKITLVMQEWGRPNL